MNSVWSPQEISDILFQLDRQGLPFSKYTLFHQSGSLRLLGSGSFAVVYCATRRNGQGTYAIKVTGFGEKHVNPQEFRSTMEAQKLLSIQCMHIVRLYAWAQMYVWLDSGNRVIRVKPYSASTATESGENRLLLQFAVLERLTPVVERSRYGSLQLTVKPLADGDEKEVFRLGKQIGSALKAVHNCKLLHRDIKLENIFYDATRKQYKLGDFGIARVVQDGLASTVAFTKGYGAPEIVGTGEDRYDCTADIYSFGMVLFVLLNELRFPDSDCYHVNAGVQYCPGYILPMPSLGSEEAFRLIEKMCRFSPDDRPQSMQTVCEEINRLGLTPVLKNRSVHDKTLALLSATLLTLGAGIWVLCGRYPESTAFFQQNPWLSPLLFSLGCLFGVQYITLRNPLYRPVRRQYSLFLWGGMMLCYGLMIVYMQLPPPKVPQDSTDLLRGIIPALVRKYQGDKIGLGGLTVCALWLLREKFRIRKPQDSGL